MKAIQVDRPKGGGMKITATVREWENILGDGRLEPAPLRDLYEASVADKPSARNVSLRFDDETGRDICTELESWNDAMVTLELRHQ